MCISFIYRELASLFVGVGVGVIKFSSIGTFIQELKLQLFNNHNIKSSTTAILCSHSGRNIGFRKTQMGWVPPSGMKSWFDKML